MIHGLGPPHSFHQMKQLLAILSFILLLSALPGAAAAQFRPCQDSTLIRPNAGCPTFYEPVCGCNGETYRNRCFAEAYAGVFDYRSGICSGIFAEITPSIGIGHYEVFIQPIKETFINATVVDIQGVVHFTRNYSKAEQVLFPLDLTAGRSGLYFLIITAGPDRKVLKFMLFS